MAQEKLRIYVLLVVSLFFYAWGEPCAIRIMMILIICSWGIGLKIESLIKQNNTPDSISKCKFVISVWNSPKSWLVLGIVINLSALLYYKYWMFFLNNLNYFSKIFHFEKLEVPIIPLPIGISFYLFQILSYLIDVYRQAVPAQKKIGYLATYISLFPQLIAGPIVRYKTIEEDLHNSKTNFENIFVGLRRFVIGLAKKVLIADQMAFIADSIFNSSIEAVPCIYAWCGILTYTLQIYYDFSGYSDMAIGLGRVFNFRFLENFNYPYGALNIRDFWRRWHISLSSWFRDYLYIPLGGNKKGVFRTYVNLYIVFGVCGLWHGATWNFVVWGLYHGTWLVLERGFWGNFLDKVQNIYIKRFHVGSVILNIYTWFIVMIGWVFFRASDLTYAWKFLKVMFDGNKDVPINSFYIATDFLTYSNLWILLMAIFCSYPIFNGKYGKFRCSKIESIFILILFVTAYVFAMTSTFSPFIYFRF
ncbi:MAG: MBOAT family protein [Alphaproteobacteria bacterium]|nr:MBOAT family protein [Alphaproteobacteria bacterium]